MGRVNRRVFMRGAGGIAALGGAAALGARDPSLAQGVDHHAGHQMIMPGTVGRVDHARNGFDPKEILTDFDGGHVGKDTRGGVVREYAWQVVTKDIEVAPGVMFPAWTYEGRVPGPTIRATEGDRIRIELLNTTEHPHSIHFHGMHSSAMDGVPGLGEAMPGETFTYDFIARPFGTHLYHCHSLPLAQHISRGLYGAFIVDPKHPRPDANEMVMVMNAFDTNFDGTNEVYAVNTIAFAYTIDPIVISAGSLQRIHLINITEFDPVNSIHLHANFFNLYRTGTSLRPDEFTDIVMMCQAERHMLEFVYDEPGRFMFHAHQTEFTDLGWMSMFEVRA